MLLYHVTTSANDRGIRARGFRERSKMIGHDEAGKPVHVRGAWFSDRPCLDGGYIDEPPDGWEAITIDLPELEAAAFEVTSEGATYREWCIPAAIASAHLAR